MFIIVQFQSYPAEKATAITVWPFHLSVCCFNYVYDSAYVYLNDQNGAVFPFLLQLTLDQLFQFYALSLSLS